MKRLTRIAGTVLLALGGCQSDSSTAIDNHISLGQMNSEEDANYYTGTGVFHLGAGDALGQEIFVNYLAQLNLERDEYYATVQPDEERIEE
ncbi:MAG: hypothetical protein O7G85_00765 [Planctomycetota bacterium]|nr:hypothetical protein [Planctomycetota bacterium]